MSKITHIIDVPEEFCNTLQRYGYEVDAAISIIDRLMTNHKDDKDASLFESVPWKHYMKEYQELQAKYTEEKNRFHEWLKPRVRELEDLDEDDEVLFDWKIDNFADKKVNVTINE